MSEDTTVEGNSPLNRVETDDIDGSVFGNAEADERLGKVDSEVVVLLVGNGLPFVGSNLISNRTYVGKLSQGLSPHLHECVGLFRARAYLLDADG